MRPVSRLCQVATGLKLALEPGYQYPGPPRGRVGTLSATRAVFAGPLVFSVGFLALTALLFECMNVRIRVLDSCTPSFSVLGRLRCGVEQVSLSR